MMLANTVQAPMMLATITNCYASSHAVRRTGWRRRRKIGFVIARDVVQYCRQHQNRLYGVYNPTHAIRTLAPAPLPPCREWFDFTMYCRSLDPLHTCRCQQSRLFGQCAWNSIFHYSPRSNHALVSASPRNDAPRARASWQVQIACVSCYPNKPTYTKYLIKVSKIFDNYINTINNNYSMSVKVQWMHREIRDELQGNPLLWPPPVMVLCFDTVTASSPCVRSA